MSALPAPDPAEVVAQHVWLPTGQALCMATAGPQLRVEAACSSCMLVLGELRRQAGRCIDAANGRYEPASATDGWRALVGTPWERAMPWVSTVGGDDYDAATRLHAPVLALDPATYR